MRLSTVSSARLPLAFEAHEEQLSGEGFFAARGIGYRVLLTADQISLTLHARRSDGKARRDDTIAIAIEGVNRACRIRGVDELPGKANYFIGSDPSKWRVGVRTFGRVEYRDIYPGIDLVFYGTGGN